MKKNIISLCLALSIIVTPLFAQTNLDLSTYDENGFVRVDDLIISESDDEIDFEPPTLFDQSINADFYKQGQPVSCFDYYSFGSVGVNLTQNYSSYEPGDVMLIGGKIENNNPYPLIGLDIKARLVKDIPAPKPLRAEVMVVDEFDVAENISIAANGQYDVRFSRTIPFNAPAGDYQVYFYAVEQDKFNMSGLSFTNDIIASKINFEIRGGAPEHVYLDQTNITVGGKNHNTMGFMTQHQKDSPIPVVIPIYNPGIETKDMTITYDLYSWDSADANNKISTRKENVTVPAESEEILTYIIEKGEHSAYYLSISAEPTNQIKDKSVFSEKTISNIRLIVQGVNKPRINFVTTNTYPLEKGKESSLITCFHNTSDQVDQNISRIETVLRDSDGNDIATSIFEGRVSPQISAISQTFSPKANIANYTIESTIYGVDNTIVERVEKKYDCKDISPDVCQVEVPQNTKLSPLAIIILLSITVVVVIVYYLQRKKALNVKEI